MPLIRPCNLMFSMGSTSTSFLICQSSTARHLQDEVRTTLLSLNHQPPDDQTTHPIQSTPGPQCNRHSQRNKVCGCLKTHSSRDFSGLLDPPSKRSPNRHSGQHPGSYDFGCKSAARQLRNLSSSVHLLPVGCVPQNLGRIHVHGSFKGSIRLRSLGPTLKNLDPQATATSNHVQVDP